MNLRLKESSTLQTIEQRCRMMLFRMHTLVLVLILCRYHRLWTGRLRQPYINLHVRLVVVLNSAVQVVKAGDHFIGIPSETRQMGAGLCVLEW